MLSYLTEIICFTLTGVPGIVQVNKKIMIPLLILSSPFLTTSPPPPRPLPPHTHTDTYTDTQHTDTHRHTHTHFPFAIPGLHLHSPNSAFPIKVLVDLPVEHLIQVPIKVIIKVPISTDVARCFSALQISLSPPHSCLTKYL